MSAEKAKSVHHKLYLAPHSVPKDQALFPSLLKGAHVVIPESVHWTKEYERGWNRIAQGKLRPEAAKFLLGGHFTSERSQNVQYELMKAVYDTRVMVAFFDAHIDHPLAARLYHVNEEGWKSSVETLINNGSLSWTARRDIIKEHLHVFGNLNNEREEHMVTEAERRTPELLLANERIKRVQNPCILWVIGAAHDQVPELLKSRGHNVSVITNRDRTSPYYWSDGFKRAMDGTLDNEMLAKVALEFYFKLAYGPQMRKAGITFEQVCLTTDSFIQSVDLNKIDQILGPAKTSGYKDYITGVIRDLAQKGQIEIPKV